MVTLYHMQNSGNSTRFDCQAQVCISFPLVDVNILKGEDREIPNPGLRDRYGISPYADGVQPAAWLADLDGART